MTENNTKILAITLGDPHGINIYAIATLLQPLLKAPPVPIVVIGSYWHWLDQLQRLNIATPDLPLVTSLSQIRGNGCYFWDVLEGKDSKPADQLADSERGKIAVRALYLLEKLKICSKIAVLTSPIDKNACAQAGFTYPGHTEFFCEKWSKGQSVMILAGPRLRVGLVTNHVAINRLAQLMSTELVEYKLALFASSLRDFFGIKTPKIAVCGFNPHCSDNGLFGNEEETILKPALEGFLARRGQQVIVHGPVPADTAFYKGYHGDYDGVLAMYHDQGLAPLKTVHFDEAVNITGGLDIFRVSPDHGPARDLYLKRTASLVSFQTALQHCLRYLDH